MWEDRDPVRRGIARRSVLASAAGLLGWPAAQGSALDAAPGSPGVADDARASLAGPFRATVGVFHRPEWGWGCTVEFAPGETVRVRHPISSVVVQSLGGPLPGFVTASPQIDEKPVFEIDVLHEAPWLGTPAGHYPDRLGHVRPKHRFVVHEAALREGLSREGALPRSDLVIAAEPSALEIVGEALTCFVTGELVITVFDSLDLFTVAGRSPDRPGRGRGVVLPGISAPDMLAPLMHRIAALERDGYGGGIFLMQLLKGEEWDSCPLVRFDALVKAVGDATSERPVIFTMAGDMSVSAVMAIAFDNDPAAAVRSFEAKYASARAAASKLRAARRSG